MAYCIICSTRPKNHLSEFKGQNMIVTFYPAAYPVLKETMKKYGKRIDGISSFFFNGRKFNAGANDLLLLVSEIAK